MGSTSYLGFGSSFSMSLDGGLTFTRIAQLKSFVPAGLKTIVVDQSAIADPDNFTRPLAVRVDAGTIALEGVLIPTNASQLSLGATQAALILATFSVVLTDGTTYAFEGYVTKYVPFTIKAKNAIAFSAEITVANGGLSAPLPPSFDNGAFDPAAFAGAFAV